MGKRRVQAPRLDFQLPELPLQAERPFHGDLRYLSQDGRELEVHPYHVEELLQLPQSAGQPLRHLVLELPYAGQIVG